MLLSREGESLAYLHACLMHGAAAAGQLVSQGLIIMRGLCSCVAPAPQAAIVDNKGNIMTTVAAAGLVVCMPCYLRFAEAAQ